MNREYAVRVKAQVLMDDQGDLCVGCITAKCTEYNWNCDRCPLDNHPLNRHKWLNMRGSAGMKLSECLDNSRYSNFVKYLKERENG
jgi:hypothetical protein